MTPPPTQWDRHFLRKLTSDEGEPKDDGRRQCGEEISQPSAVAPEETEKGSGHRGLRSKSHGLPRSSG